MKRMKKLVLLTAALTLGGILTACGAKKNDSADGEQKEIEFFFQKQEMVPTMKEIIKDFEEKNPDIKVKLTNVPDGLTVLKTRMASNDVPDIVHAYPALPDFVEWSKNDMFEDLTGSDIMKDIKTGAAESYAVDDKIYSVPLTNNAYGFFYNKTEFEKLGLEEPKTWAEFEEIVKTIKKDGKTPFSAALTTDAAGFLNGFHQLAWATITGGHEQANDYLLRSPQDSIKADDSTFEKVADELDIMRDNTQKNANGATYDDAVAAFASGDAMIFANGIWALPAIQSQDPEFEVGMFAHPGVKEGEELTAGAADLAVSISKTTKNKEAAEKFVSYLASKEAMQKYYDVDGSPTFVTTVDTEGKFPEIEEVSKLVGTNKQIIWLHNEWDSEADFWYATVDYINNGDREQLAKNLNTFFDAMKK
ncbi:extracellular solute-binding protein [uncultured Enterococcus sp.]|uniref:extracellular solute-binding protein n=1 Tax=uncultured Enterococcus sp. TaxID=167972 RepID=UPI002AA866A5|nr:extracellular solute-binding protein [uncultured Enterococcus sp.]